MLIKNGIIVDGTGNPWFKADVAISNGKISKVRNLGSAKAEKVIDAKGLIVAPGFIDIHTHSDFTLLINSRAESKIRQGVTMEVIGNCGSSAAPLNDDVRSELRKLTWLNIEGASLDLDWNTFGEYLDELQRKRPSVNVAALVGHGNIRILGMGLEMRTPKASELKKMKQILSECLDDGAFGMSTGLIYPPSCYASLDELVELSKIVAKKGGFYASHIRGEGDTLIDAVNEAIAIGENSGVPVQISHHKAAGSNNWGKVKTTLKMLRDARSRGVDVTCDVYPYTATSFGLASVLPPWVHDGGVDAIIKRLKSSEMREKIRRDMDEGVPGWSSPLKGVGWSNIFVVNSKKHSEYEGKNIEDLAKAAKTNPYDFAYDLLIDDETATSVIRFALNEDDVCMVLKSDLVAVGSDGYSLAAYGPLSKGKPHPRSYGTFARVFSKYVKEKEVLGLEEAVKKMTSLPARRLGIWDRGIIRPGAWADVTVFNFQNIGDVATFDNPHQYAKGISYVFVNGELTLDCGEHTGAGAGMVLRK